MTPDCPAVRPMNRDSPTQAWTPHIGAPCAFTLETHMFDPRYLSSALAFALLATACSANVDSSRSQPVAPVQVQPPTGVGLGAGGEQ